MSSTWYTDEFTAEAVKQDPERGFTAVEVAARIGLPKHTLYDWVQKAKEASRREASPIVEKTDSARIRRLKPELRRMLE